MRRASTGAEPMVISFAVAYGNASFDASSSHVDDGASRREVAHDHAAIVG
jgi:hypothetical protein